MTESLTDGVTLGIYEKALVGNPLATDDPRQDSASSTCPSMSLKRGWHGSDGTSAGVAWCAIALRPQKPLLVVSACRYIGVLALVVPTQPCASELGR